MATSTWDEPVIASRPEWLAARAELLAKEKTLTRQRQALSEERRRLPWVRVDKPYVFEGADGAVTLDALFGRNQQLAVYHFMFDPGWQEGCKRCSLVSDHLDRSAAHLAHHDLTVMAVSRAPWASIEPFRRRMGWTFPWVSSFGTDFNYDFEASIPASEGQSGPVPSREVHGVSVFAKRGDEVFHTYSCYRRAVEDLLGVYAYLDLTPKGRDERLPMDWVRHHDRYDTAGPAR